MSASMNLFWLAPDFLSHFCRPTLLDSWRGQVDYLSSPKSPSSNFKQEPRMNTINLDRYATLEEFRAAMMVAMQSGQMSIVVSQSEVVFTAVPLDVAKESIARNVANRLADHPDLLVELKRRLEEEEPEDWDD